LSARAIPSACSVSRKKLTQMPNEPIVYTGRALDEFIIDRAALGFDTDSIISEYKSLHGTIPLGFDKDFILQKMKEHEAAIRKRELQLIQLYSNSNLLARLDTLQSELERVKGEALERNDLRTYALLASQLLKSLELFAKSVKHFQDEEKEVRTQLSQQNNYYLFVDLQKHGLIDIKNVEELKKIVGCTDEEPEPGSVD
jgi:hypothetical protein